MLHAALIGFPSTGKSTLFQLMTSTKDAPKGKGDTVVGISKVPDARLDRLTAMFNPKKRVPATIEFTDIVAPGRTGAAALVDVAGYKNADALVHVVRAFRDPAVPHPSGSVDPARDAQAMEDELILADLGVVERRLERMDKDLKKSKTAELEKEKDLLGKCKTALENGQPLDPEKLYTVIMPDFIAAGGDGAMEVMKSIPADRIQTSFAAPIRDVLIQQLAGRTDLEPKIEGRITVLNRPTQ